MTARRTIIAGSREILNRDAVFDAIASCPWSISVVLCGMARGADSIGEMWANQNKIPVERYPAQWNRHGKSAGPIRNELMAVAAGGEGGLVLVWYGDSPGSRHMLGIARSRGLAIHEVRLTRP